MIDSSYDIDQLNKWFEHHKRSFPWRNNPSPYAVWVSEMMLQQTRASVVISYYIRWMHSFPTVQHLAAASAESVIKSWEGLGYYSRARYLHQGAQQIITQFNGIFPSEANDLQQIKGLGPYTIGAIRSFAFHQKAVAVDGNVLRVLSRYFGIEENILQSSARKKIEQHAIQLLPKEEPWKTAEAFIELGALVCTTTPQCALCPLQKNCIALQQNKTKQLPHKGPKKVIQSLYRNVAVIIWNKQILLHYVDSGKVMTGLYEFPYWNVTDDKIDFANFYKQISIQLNLSLSLTQTLPPFKHTFTRFRVTLYPYLFTSEHDSSPSLLPYQWVAWNQIEHLAFSAGHRKILEYVKQTIPNS